jgi:hypothetical protein
MLSSSSSEDCSPSSWPHKGHFPAVASTYTIRLIANCAGVAPLAVIVVGPVGRDIQRRRQTEVQAHQVGQELGLDQQSNGSGNYRNSSEGQSPETPPNHRNDRALVKRQ